MLQINKEINNVSTMNVANAVFFPKILAFGKKNCIGFTLSSYISGDVQASSIRIKTRVYN